MPGVIYEDVVTAYGEGVIALWQGILSQKTAIKDFNRFDTAGFQSQKAAFAAGLDAQSRESLVMQMLEDMLLRAKKYVKPQTMLFFATTTGEIEFLERAVEASEDQKKSSPLFLLEKVKKILGVKNGIVVSAACASSSIAVARAAAALESKTISSAAVVACDSISRFVFSGFSSLMALDPEGARPFDKNRRGLTAGESAGILILSPDAKKSLYQIKSWGLSCDANHITGPSRDGAGLAQAISKAMCMGKLKPEDITAICAHGTGTLYNDSMEMKAFKRVFAKPLPVYSIKGAIGHTMAAAGLNQIIVAAQGLKSSIVPATVNLCDVDEEALGWAQTQALDQGGNYSLVVNSGFGGINCALVVGN